jgi:uncharacterized protein involved in exopolysaccharide biosynthesis
MENYFRNKGLFDLIKRWKLHLLIIAVVSGSLGIIFSSQKFIEPKFKSIAVLYPVNISPLSKESETEQMLELIQSQDIRFRIYDAFNLSSHYGIAENDSHIIAKTNKLFDGNANFSKTENEAIKITVSDTDPVIASNITDSIISFYNDLLLTLNREKSTELATAITTQINRKQLLIDSLTNVLNGLRKEHNILNYDIQIKEYTRAIANGKNLAETRQTLNNMKNVGGEYLHTDSLLWNAMSDSHKMGIKLDNYILDKSKVITYSHVVTKPYPADKKSYPTRWSFVVFSILGGLFAGIIVLILIDKAKFSKDERE